MRGFNMIGPMAVTSAVLTGTNVTEATAAWSAVVTFDAADDVAHDGQLWRSLQGSNLNHEPGVAGSEDWWQLLGPTNPMAMFDDFISTQSENADSIEVELTAPAAQRIDAIWLDNLAGLSVTVTQTDGADGLVYSETQSLNDNSGITNIWAYLTAPIRRRTWALFEPRGGYAGSVFTVDIDLPGGTAKCGDLVPGQAARLGLTKYEGDDGVIDFSGKARNETTGGFEVDERSYADEMSHNILIARGDWDVVRGLLIAARAQRRVFVAFAGHRGTIVNGYLTSWRNLYSTHAHYVVALKAESLA